MLFCPSLFQINTDLYDLAVFLFVWLSLVWNVQRKQKMKLLLLSLQLCMKPLIPFYRIYYLYPCESVIVHRSPTDRSPSSGRSSGVQ